MHLLQDRELFRSQAIQLWKQFLQISISLIENSLSSSIEVDEINIQRLPWLTFIMDLTEKDPAEKVYSVPVSLPTFSVNGHSTMFLISFEVEITLAEHEWRR